MSENPALGIRHVHVPKTGGTWLREVLGLRGVRASERPLTTIGIVRHPVEWHASSFRFFVVQRGGPHPLWWAASDGGRRSCSDTIRALYEDRDATYARAMRRAIRLDAGAHVLMATGPEAIRRWHASGLGLLQYLIDQEYAACDHVLRLEAIRDELAARLPEVWATRREAIESTPPRNVTPRPPTHEDIDDHARRLIQETHSRMMEDYGYAPA